jgi:hypothetical protein
MITLCEILEQKPRILWAFSETGINVKGIRIADSFDDSTCRRYLCFILNDQEYKKINSYCLEFSNFISCMLTCGVIILPEAEIGEEAWLKCNSTFFDKNENAKLSQMFAIDSLEKNELEKIKFDPPSFLFQKPQENIKIDGKILSKDDWNAVPTDQTFHIEPS